MNSDRKVDDWHTQHPDEPIPAWFTALDPDLRADLIKHGWIEGVKTSFPLSEKGMYACLIEYAKTIQAQRDEVVRLSTALFVVSGTLPAVGLYDAQIQSEWPGQIENAQQTIRRALDGDA